MTITALTATIAAAFRAYDPQITVSAPSRCAVGSRLMVGEKSKKGFKSLGYIDIAADADSSAYAAMDGDRPVMDLHFTTRSATLSGIVAGAF